MLALHAEQEYITYSMYIYMYLYIIEGSALP